MCENGCGCSAPSADDATTTGLSAGVSTTYTVTGMTCGHCVSSVSSEVGATPGVSDVTVNLAGGTVTVTSEKPLDSTLIRAAVEEAGYELVTSP